MSHAPEWKYCSEHMHVCLLSTTHHDIENAVRWRLAGDIFRVPWIDLTETKEVLTYKHPRKGPIPLLVTRSMLSEWHVDNEQVWNAAAIGDSEYADVIQDLNIRVCGKPASGPYRPYVITDTSGLFGARAIQSGHIRKTLQTYFPEGLYLIPSSINDWIAVSKQTISISVLEDHLQRINDTLSPTQKLSNHIFTLHDGRIRLARDDTNRR